MSEVADLEATQLFWENELRRAAEAGASYEELGLIRSTLKMVSAMLSEALYQHDDTIRLDRPLNGGARVIEVGDDASTEELSK